MEVANVVITHPDRVVYPELGVTKVDVARHFARVATLMLPHIKDRPLALVRCPEGSGAQCFFQKHWVGTLPDAIDTVMIEQSDGKRHPHVVVNNREGLVTLAQWGVLEVHLWGARADNPDRPDRVVFDLDPGTGVPWDEVKEAARALRGVLEGLALKSWVKSTGGKGLHVVLPIGRYHSWDEVKDFSHHVAEALAADSPKRFISKASKAARSGKIYIDWLRNARGASSIAPWSSRARKNAGIAVPFAWTKLGQVDSGSDVTLATRFRLPASDPWEEMLKTKQRLP